MPLTSQQIRYLRGLTHSLQPVVMVADKGLNENVMIEIETALQHHELIKIKIRADRETRTAWINRISEQCSAEKVHVIGQVACFFRRNRKKPIIALPGKQVNAKHGSEMDLTWQRPGEHHYIHSVSADGIRVVDQVCTGSIIVSTNRLITDWPVINPGEITADHIAQILELEPEIVLIGTGERQIFLEPEMLMHFYKRSVGVEIMSTRAACDTFNILVSEGRNVVAALLQASTPSSTSP